MDFAAYEKQVCASIGEFCRERVTPETSINGGFQSLGVDGDDAVDLLNHLSEKFGTSFERFPHARFFGPESLPVASAVALLWQRLTGTSKPLEQVTAGDLASFMWREREISGT